MPYRDAWAIQEQAHARVLAGEPERILLVEHPAVITIGRRPNGFEHLVASRDALANMGIELVESDRGGDITFHGPGQLVAYPIVRLNDHRLSVGGYVHRLEDAIIQTLTSWDIQAGKDACAVGVWVPINADTTAKVAAIGMRVRRGVTLHGLALNVTTDLRYFDLIVPCGLACRPVTSMHSLLGDACPTMPDVKHRLAQELQQAIATLPAHAHDGART